MTKLQRTPRFEDHQLVELLIEVPRGRLAVFCCYEWKCAASYATVKPQNLSA
jgi:hypothetical protein